MSEYRCQSKDLCMEPHETEDDWWRRLFKEYDACKDYILRSAREDGVSPERLSYDVEFLRCKWDLSIVVTGIVGEML
jgi:hypothetical protein